jgi:5'-3' exonuclease
MIILDLNQVMISNLMASLKHSDLNENLLRHMILNSIRLYRNKFYSKYGELVIACDDKDYWRRKMFPYYKSNRKKMREQSDLDWTEIFRVLNMVRDELKEFFPYPTIQISSAEADDIIASICKKYGRQLGGDPLLILSGDKDFQQLQKYANVDQYDPVRKRWLKCNDPAGFLMEHIFRGDTSDGVPNILSADDTFVSNARQRPLRAKKMDEMIRQSIADWPEDLQRNYYRNKQMIDLDLVPEDIYEEVMSQMNQEKDRSKLWNYFIKKKLKNLTECISEF